MRSMVVPGPNGPHNNDDDASPDRPILGRALDDLIRAFFSIPLVFLVFRRDAVCLRPVPPRR